MSFLDEQSLLSSMSLLSRSPSPPLLPSGFVCIVMLSVTYGTTLSLSNYSFWIFSTCFQYPCWSSFVTNHTKSSVTCSNFWRCIPTVMFSCASLFNLCSCELYRFMSHIQRQSNCMTMINQYVINFVDTSLHFCGRINW